MNRRELIINSKDWKEKNISVPEWGTDVIVRSLTGRQRKDVAKIVGDGKDPEKVFDAEVKAVLWAVHDPETNARIFADTDIDAVRDMNPVLLDKLFQEIGELTGLDEVAAITKTTESPAAKLQESAVKN